MARTRTCMWVNAVPSARFGELEVREHRRARGRRISRSKAPRIASERVLDPYPIIVRVQICVACSAF